MNIWDLGIEKKPQAKAHGGLVAEKTQNKNHSWKVQNFEGDRQEKFLCFCGSELQHHWEDLCNCEI